MSGVDTDLVRRLVSKIKRMAARYGANCRIDGDSGEMSKATLEAFGTLSAEIDILAALIPAAAPVHHDDILKHAAIQWRHTLQIYDAAQARRVDFANLRRVIAKNPKSKESA